MITDKTWFIEVFFVDQSTIAENEPQQVYLTIKIIRKILITHRIYMDYKQNRRNTLSPSYCSNI